MKLKAKSAFKIFNPQTDDFMFGSIAANRGWGGGGGHLMYPFIRLQKF
jgi:hypothetical protein